jgi:DNA gyrase subunit B
MSYADMMKNDVLLNIIKILGCGIGTQFNIQNLRWNKIIILNDADADGGFIKSLNCTFFARAMPGLIEEGRLYAGVPPLYIIDDKSTKKYKLKQNFIFDKHEYYSIIDNIIASNVELGIKIEDTDDYQILNKKETLEWLLRTREYATILKDLHDRTSCETTILEHACWAIVNYPNYLDPKSKHGEQMAKYFKKYFPEMDYNQADCSLNGSYNRKYYSLILDKIFVTMAKDMIAALSQENALLVSYKNKSEDSVYKVVTIGEFIAAVRGIYALNFEQRFKGLGEIESELLFYTTLNPKVRHLIRLTMDDKDAALNTLHNLHGSNTSEFRRNLLLNATISDDDIDN